MHNCKANRDSLIALALNPPDQTQPLSVELEACAACREEYTALRTLQRMVDQTKESVLPAEGFWPGYHARLRQHLETGSNVGVRSAAAESRISLRSLRGNLLSSSVRVPIPVAAALLIFLGVSLVFALNSRRPVNALTPIIVTRTVEIPVTREKIRDRVVSRFIYSEKVRGQLVSSSTNSMPRQYKEPAGEEPISLAGFTPTNEVKLTIIKGSYQR
ncbi:MAG TPA: hypothetical protein VN956_13270 [Pyrinomonadaceae bacterium]|nr:hypothetical protein [Pyrinomonadaceae bacterium]